MNKKRLGIFLSSIALLIVCSFAAYQYWFAPTRILIINATLAQATDIALNNDCARIKVTCIKKEEVKDLSGYDAIVMYSRGYTLMTARLPKWNGGCQRSTGLYEYVTKFHPLPQSQCYQ